MRRWGIAEAAVLALLFAFHLASFRSESTVHGPYEVFGQDSVFLLENLERGQPYPWNPQSHLLYHALLEGGYALFRLLPGEDSAYAYLKLFSALWGLAFLLGMRALFRELGLGAPLRIALLFLGGVSVSAWFHFAAFETHAPAMPAVALWLLTLARMRARPARGALERVGFVAALLVCGWTRIDLFRFAAASGVLLLLPSLRRHRRTLAADLALVAVLGALGTAALARAYLGVDLSKASTVALERDDRDALSARMGRVANLGPSGLVRVGRAISTYSMLMPVERRSTARSFFAPPTFDAELEYSGRGIYPTTALFLEPARNLATNALSLAALSLVLLLAGLALRSGISRLRAVDPLWAGIAAQALVGWLLYAWFNPFEPFLWIVEFLPLWLALLADSSRERERPMAALVLAAVAVVFVHNLFAFYLPFR